MEKITSKEPVEIKNEPFWTNSTNVLKIESEELQFSSHLINKDTVKREFTQELHNVETKFLNYEVDLPPLKNDDEDIEDYSNLNKETVEIEHEPSWANSTNVLKVESEELQVSSHLISKVPIKKEFKQEFDSIETKFLNHEIDLPALKNEEEIEDYSNEQLTTDANVTGTNHPPSQSSTELSASYPGEIPDTCEKLHQCKICLKQCLSSSGLQHHNKIHTRVRVDTSVKPYECQICLKRYSDKSDLKAHTEVQQCVPVPIQCKICLKRFTNRQYLVIHFRIHTGENEYQCEICLRKFSQAHSLILHSRIHTGEKPYTCEICFKRFSQKGTLTTHTKIHTGEKPYQCHICSKQFLHKRDCTKHYQTHTKPYKCEICFKQFSRENALTTHTKMHTGEKPYQCQICPKQFFRKKSLTRHSQNHAGTDLVN